MLSSSVMMLNSILGVVVLPETELGFDAMDYVDAALLKFGTWYAAVLGIFFLAALITLIKFRARNAISHAK